MPAIIAKFDGREIVRHCVAAHGQYLVIWRGTVITPTTTRSCCRNAGLGNRDPLREAVEEARNMRFR